MKMKKLGSLHLLLKWPRMLLYYFVKLSFGRLQITLYCIETNAVKLWVWEIIKRSGFSHFFPNMSPWGIVKDPSLVLVLHSWSVCALDYNNQKHVIWTV